MRSKHDVQFTSLDAIASGKLPEHIVIHQIQIQIQVSSKPLKSSEYLLAYEGGEG